MAYEKNILLIGGNGLVGSRIFELLNPFFSFENIDRSDGVDITDKGAIEEKIKSSSSLIVVHFAAKTDVNLCEQDKELDTRFKSGNSSEQEIIKKQTSWAINVLGTQNVAQACEQSAKKLVYISTDFVFSGDNTPKDGYTEESTPGPINWYGQTKYEGEKVIQTLKTPWVIIRIAYPYRANFHKKDYVRVFLSLLQQGKKFTAITDHIFTPTFIDDIGFALKVIFNENIQGVYHVTGSQSLSPHEAAGMIAKKFALNENLINTTTRDEFFKGKAPRPFNLAMNNDKIRKLGIQMRTFEEGLEEVKNQLEKR